MYSENLGEKNWVMGINGKTKSDRQRKGRGTEGGGGARHLYTYFSYDYYICEQKLHFALFLCYILTESWADIQNGMYGNLAE